MSTRFRLSQVLPLLVIIAKFGEALAESRIVGGNDANPRRYPYFATLYRSDIRINEFTCGGSLIAPDVILSAAHCIDESVPINYVVVNNTNHGGTNPYGHARRIVDTIVHPSWDPVTLRNDLMLLILAEPVDVEPIAYSRQFPAITILDTLQILGLGRLEDGGSLPTTLQEAQVGLSDFDDCDDAYSNGGLLSFLTGLSESSQFCAAGLGIDSCQGDSGGPLILLSSSDTTTDVQIGLVSFGSGCARVEFPGVYTKLSAFASWMDAKICEKSQSTPAFCSTSQAPIMNEGLTGRNVRISASGLTIATHPQQGLEVKRFGGAESSWSFTNGVLSFDDLAIDGDFVFAFDVENKAICSYLVASATDEVILQSCYQGHSWNMGYFAGISCMQGVCVIAQGEEGMTILNYDTTTGIIIGSPRISNLSFDNVYAFVDVKMISSTVAAMSTHFRNGISVFKPRYGTMLVNLVTFQNINDSFRIRQNALRSNLAVAPTNFALVSAVYYDTSSTFLFTAHGGMTVQSVVDSGSTEEIRNHVLDGKFRAITVAVDDAGIVAFGGVIEEDGRNYLMVFDLTNNPMKPAFLGLFQIPFRITSIDIRDSVVAVVGSDSLMLDLSDELSDSSLSGSSSGGGDGSGRPSFGPGTGGDIIDGSGLFSASATIKLGLEILLGAGAVLLSMSY